MTQLSLNPILKRLLQTFREPVPKETRRALKTAWEKIPPALRTSQQYMGRQYGGCGALIGAMPRCDFACRGCYLGGEANLAPPLPLSKLDEQMSLMRTWLGEGGNVQLTDGELTLRDPDELVALVRSARAHGLAPMLMTHGDAILRNPSLLVRLVKEGGLRELSIHIDTTQKGRRNREFRYATEEIDLNPLRYEFAQLIRKVRKETGKPLEVASTVTVTRENISQVNDVVRYMVGLSDAFKMVSFQPVAAVGRTEEEISESVDVPELWEQIEKGLQLTSLGAKGSEPHRGWLGHPDCSQFIQGLVIRRRDESPRFFPLFDARDASHRILREELLDRFGGLSFRLDSPARAVARGTGLVMRHFFFLVRRVLPHLWKRSRGTLEEGLLEFFIDMLRGKTHCSYFNIVSHHFMNAEEIASSRGQERLSACAFQVPIEGELKSMCEVNALGMRDALYDSLREGKAS